MVHVSIHVQIHSGLRNATMIHLSVSINHNRNNFKHSNVTRRTSPVLKKRDSEVL
jgi:hypothetical protein